jgi:hypothetical protein
LASLDVTEAGPLVEVRGQESMRIVAVAVDEQCYVPVRYCSSSAMPEIVLSDLLPGF